MLASQLSEADYCLYEDAEKLEAAALNDPEEEPHKSRYAAEKVWLELTENLNSALAQLSDSNSIRGVLAGVYLKLAKNVVQCEEREKGKAYCLKGLTYLTKAEDVLDDPLETELALSEETAHSYLSLLNYLGFLSESMGDHDYALKWLRDAETVFNAYKIQQEAAPPHNLTCTMKQIGAQFTNGAEYSDGAEFSDELWKAFESLHTYTIYYLAQVYKNMDDATVAAEYCEKTLVRQLETNEYDPLEWSLNCATLSQFYLGKTTTWNQKNFAQARHCLAAAEAVAETIALPAEDDEYANDKVEQCRADINRCWAKYGISLLETSQQSFLYKNDPEDFKDKNNKEMPPNFDDSLAEI
uniref:KIF-binding protein n=1 Tax=Plectus sambesii TaxID=2011161 RepID=A0A914VB80_9BILA